MNPDVLLNRIRLEQRGLIDIHKKLYEMEHLLPVPDPMQFAKTAESAALLSEKSTAHLRNMFFSVSNEPPIYYYPKAAEVQGIRVWADTNYLRVLLPALLPDKKKRDGCKFLLLPLQAALVQSGSLPHFSNCVICVEHIYDHNLPIKAVRDYDNLELKAVMNNDIFTPDLPIPEPVGFEDAPISAPVEDEKPTETPPPRRRHKANAPVLTIESGDEIETEDAREAAAWHEIHNAYRTRRILSAPLGGIEQTDSGKTIAVVDYNGFRIVIPLKEMMVAPSATNSTDSMAVRQMKLLGNMLGAEIDFVILGIDSKSRSVVASRREAMMRKRQLFYFSLDANGEYRVREGRVVQARVIAVADKSIRVEIFGVECSIMARDLAWDWIGDAHDRFAVSDQILVRVTEVNKTSQEELSVHADVKSVTENTSHEALKRCRVQSKYAGRVTDVHKGIVYVRLSNGVNAVAHSCYDRRTPGKKDDVSFVVTKLDEERSIAVGIITRIIRQNL